MPNSKRLTPQEKKRLSLKKDFRDDYGQNDKASRRLVPLRKRLANRALRRGDKVDLATDPEQAEKRLPKRLKSRWKKSPGQPLTAAVKMKVERQIQRENGKKRRALQSKVFNMYFTGEIDEAEYRATMREVWDNLC